MYGDGNGARSKLSNAATYQKCGVLGSGNITIPKNRIQLSIDPNMGACVGAKQLLCDH